MKRYNDDLVVDIIERAVFYEFFYRIIIIRVFYRFLIIWLLWDFLGIRFIFRRIFPLSDLKQEKNRHKNPPISFGFWLIGIYAAFYGLASQRYENRLDKIETKQAMVMSQIAINKTRRIALRRIGELGKQKLPTRPELFNPYLTIISMISKFDKKYYESTDIIKPIIEEFKDSLPKKVYLNEVDLSEANLDSAYLREAFLNGANLIRADFSGADLDRAYLNGANLIRADLSGANLIRAELRGADLDSADLRGADLDSADLRGADLSGADLDSADLRGADLDSTDLRGAYLRRADLSGAYLSGANLKGAYLKGANLSGAYLSEANLDSAYLSGADLSGADLSGADLDSADLKGADLNGTRKLTIGQLKEVKSLCKTRLDSALFTQVKHFCPEKLTD